MEPTLAIVLLIVCVVIGGLFAVKKTRFISRAGIYVGIFLISVFIQCLPYFLHTPSTWAETYVSGIFMGGVISLFIHVTPTVLAYHAVKCWLIRKSRRSPN
jgi:hypothetical protein